MDATMRMAAGVVLMACCAMFGKALSAAQKRRMRFLEDALRGARALERLILIRKLPAAQALRECGFPPFQEAAGRMAENHLDPDAAWSLTETGESVRPAAPADREALSRLFAMLGTGDLAAQGEYLKEAQAAMTEQLEVARKRREETGKLYPTLGALTGLALAVLFY